MIDKQKLKKNYFNSLSNSVLTLTALFIIIMTAYFLLSWLLFDATFFNHTAAECRESSGFCYPFIQEKAKIIIFGLYPSQHLWRPTLMIVLFLLLMGRSFHLKNWNRPLLLAWGLLFIISPLLLSGKWLGLPEVNQSLFGGLPLTLLLSIASIILAYPLGVLLALGRISKLPIIKTICIVFIEMIRGVPLIGLLFMASLLVPLVLPEGFNINKILRAQTALMLFTAAYLAEVIRGAIASIDKGQLEAASSLNLTYIQTMRLIVLPQALKIAIPSTINTFIAIFKDTSLVIIISLFDLMYAAKAALTDSNWLGFAPESYFFVAVIYFIFCYGISLFGKNLERELAYESKL